MIKNSHVTLTAALFQDANTRAAIEIDPRAVQRFYQDDRGTCIEYLNPDQCHVLARTAEKPEEVLAVLNGKVSDFMKSEWLRLSIADAREYLTANKSKLQAGHPEYSRIDALLQPGVLEESGANGRHHIIVTRSMDMKKNYFSAYFKKASVFSSPKDCPRDENERDISTSFAEASVRFERDHRAEEDIELQKKREQQRSASEAQLQSGRGCFER